MEDREVLQKGIPSPVAFHMEVVPFRNRTVSHWYADEARHAPDASAQTDCAAP